MSEAARASIAPASAHAWHVRCFESTEEALTAADNPTDMNAFAPDLSQYWLPASAAAANTADVAVRDDDAVAAALLRELEVLVERVNAARSIF